MQSAGAGPSTQRGPAAQPTTETIQQMLEENQRFIQAAMEHQNAGNLHAAAQYQQRLQQNLMYLAAIADAQPQAPLIRFETCHEAPIHLLRPKVWSVQSSGQMASLAAQTRDYCLRRQPTEPCDCHCNAAENIRAVKLEKNRARKHMKKQEPVT
ncbi:hypothetical protein WJX74_010279 [Apatococcus lobatus]|uniref:SS18 N-terminal domain-containing protein n=1 Tax=Apatococcus lobatus TaxID=904363 RepID=A0AAW1S4B0_9CHLO